MMNRRQVLKSSCAAALAAVAPIPAMGAAEAFPVETLDCSDLVGREFHVPYPISAQSISARILEINQSRTDFEGVWVEWNQKLYAYEIKTTYSVAGKSEIPLYVEFLENPNRAAAFLGFPDDTVEYLGVEYDSSLASYQFIYWQAGIGIGE